MGFLSVVGILSLLGLFGGKKEEQYNFYYIENQQKPLKKQTYIENEENIEKYFSICNTIIGLLPKEKFGMGLIGGQIYYNNHKICSVPYNFIKFSGKELDDKILNFVENVMQKYY